MDMEMMLHPMLLLCLVTILFLFPTICAIENALKAYDENGEATEPQRWAPKEEEADRNDKAMAKAESGSMAPIRSFWGEGSEEDGAIIPTYQQTNTLISDNDQTDEWSWGEGRGMTGEVDIRKDPWMKKGENLGDEGEEEKGQMMMMRHHFGAIPLPALSLMPKRRRRVGTMDGRQTKKNAIRKGEKMAKPSVPTTFPDSGGIELNVQSDFVEKSDGETTAEEQKTAKTEERKGKTRREEKQREEGEKEGEKHGKGGSRSRAILTAGRDFWANALRTLLIEFRKMHPELIRGGGKAFNQQRTEQRNGTKSDNGTETREEREGEKRGMTGSSSGWWTRTDNRLEDD